MIRSMTGFGEAAVELRQGELRATVKTVNHRFFNAHLRTPPGFDRYEADLQALLKGFFARGHVNLTLTLDRAPGAETVPLPELDLERARHFRDLLHTLRDTLDLPGTVDLPGLVRVGEVFRPPEKGREEEALDPTTIQEVVSRAAEGAVARREEEGARLRDDLLGRLDSMVGELEKVKERAPIRLKVERDRLREAIRELTLQEEVDEDRLAREIAYLSERWDLHEEVVRFEAHIVAFRGTVDSPSHKAVGKRLGFLVQEMHREANTIASKANDLEIGHASVAIREEIERLREQVENVE